LQSAELKSLIPSALRNVILFPSKLLVDDVAVHIHVLIQHRQDGINCSGTHGSGGDESPVAAALTDKGRNGGTYEGAR
jgi:hypothetical protein